MSKSTRLGRLEGKIERIEIEIGVLAVLILGLYGVRLT